MRRERAGAEAVALLIAFVLHGGLIALQPLERRKAIAAQRGPADELEISVWEGDETVATVPSDGRLAEDTTERRTGDPPPISGRVASAAILQGDELEAHATASQPTETTPSPGAQEISRPDSGRSVDLGIGPNSWQRWVTESQPQDPQRRGTDRRQRPLVRAPPVSSTGGLQEGLEQRDRDLGLSPAGRIVSALYQASLGKSPRASEAVFAVTISRAGGVDVALLHSTTGSRDWQSVAQQAATSLREKRPRIPSTRNGVRVVLKLVTVEVLPSGATLDEPKGLSALLPRLGDPVDVGANARKIIRTRVQEETLF